jgi:hypothetical protein
MLKMENLNVAHILAEILNIQLSGVIFLDKLLESLFNLLLFNPFISVGRINYTYNHNDGKLQRRINLLYHEYQ